MNENLESIKEKIEEIIEEIKKGRRRKNKKQMLLVWRRWKVIKIFLNLEKRRGIQDEIRKLGKKTKNIRKRFRMNYYFSINLFLETWQETLPEDCKRFLNDVFVSKLKYEIVKRI